MHRFIGLMMLFALALAAPLNLDPTQDALRPSLALDSQNRPYVAWVEKNGEVYSAYVAHWNGLEWIRLGEALNQDPHQSVAYVSLALNKQDQAVVAWGEKPLSQQGKVVGSGKLYVAKWNGQSWQPIGPSPSHSENTVADIPILRLDSKGYPVICWSEMPPDFNVDNVYVSRWNGKAWQAVDNGSLTIDISTASRARDLAVRKNDDLMLAWSWQIYRKDFNVYAGPYTGKGHWTKMGGSLNRNPDRYAGAPSLALDAQDRPLVAFVEADKGFDLWVKRWDGKGWYTLGKSVNNQSGGARSPKIAVGASDQPTVAFADNLGNDRLWVRHWDGKNWQPYGEALNINPKANVLSYDLRLDGSGSPWVVWSEEAEGIHQIFLKYWDGSSWVEF